MQTVTRSAFLQAKSFVQSNARLLDQRLFEYYFEGGSAEAVSDELAAYQNSDGGFGKSLEPDFCLELSSPMASTIGFQYLQEIGATSANPLVKSGMAYFLNSFDPTHNGWLQVPPEVNDVPRAPWWQYDAEGIEEFFEKAWGNPGAEIVGYFHAYRELSPNGMLDKLTRHALLFLEMQPDEMEMHIFLCYVRLAKHLPEPQKTAVMSILKRRILHNVALDPDSWAGYGLPPLAVANSPDSPLAELVESALPANLDFVIAQQQEDGAWYPNWAWGQFEEVWPKARLEWAGAITVKNLRMLQNFGRVEGI